MRIITGKYKGFSLFTVPGNTTRPTTDYMREVVFSMYNDYTDLRVLDLFAGTGSYGLEAISRDAMWVDFVEFSNKAISILMKNIEKLGCAELCHVHRRKVSVFLSDEHNPYDVIFLDPPYNHKLVNETIRLIFEHDLLAPEGMIIAEHSPHERIEPALQDRITKTKAGKVTSITVLQ